MGCLPVKPTQEHLLDAVTNPRGPFLSAPSVLKPQCVEFIKQVMVNIFCYGFFFFFFKKKFQCKKLHPGSCLLYLHSHWLFILHLSFNVMFRFWFLFFGKQEMVGCHPWPTHPSARIKPGLDAACCQTWTLGSQTLSWSVSLLMKETHFSYVMFLSVSLLSHWHQFIYILQ